MGSQNLNSSEISDQTKTILLFFKFQSKGRFYSSSSGTWFKFLLLETDKVFPNVHEISNELTFWMRKKSIRGPNQLGF